MPKTAVTGSIIALKLDRSAREPMHRQFADRLREAIQDGRIPVGAKLPSTRIFAEELGVSRNTVLQVFETLTQEGFLSGRVGAGTFVAATSVAAEAAAPGDGGTGGYPFRTLSRRGGGILSSAGDEFAERPTTFMPDVPDLREFPIKTWLRLLNETSGRLTGEILADTSNAGYEPLRRAIAQHLNASRGMRCDFSQVIVTTGSQQSLDLICRMMLDPGDPVWLEEPGYVGSRAVVRANGGTIYPVPVDGDGMCIEEAAARHPVPRLIVASPSRHYPLGPALSLARRHALVRFARKGGSWIVEDDYDNEFRYAGASLPAVFGLDGDSRTFHVGTFSKILLPSFRLGYLVVPSDLADAFAKARAILDRHASLIEQMVLSEFMLRGLFVSHVRRMRGLYRARQSQMIEGLNALFGRDLPFAATDTGVHVILRLSEEADDRRLVRAAAERGVVIRPLSPYYASGRPQQGLLLGFSAFNAGEIGQGLARLAPLRADILSLGALPDRVAIGQGSESSP